MKGIEELTIVGASEDEEKYGHKVLRKALENKIKVYAVNQNKRTIKVKLNGDTEKEISSFRNIRELPETTEYVALYIPRRSIIEGDLIYQISKKGFKRVIIPPEEEITQESLELGNEIRNRLRNEGYEDKDILLDVCYLRE